MTITHGPLPSSAPTRRRGASPELQRSPAGPVPLAAPAGRGSHLFLDIATLREPQFTGIPFVAANLAREVIEARIPCTFFIGENVIRREYVQFLLASGSGSYFAYHHQLGQTIECGLLQRVREVRHSVGLFPAEKPFHRLFDFEVQVVHDLSTIATPYFHKQATNELHGQNLLADTLSNDLNICVSRATAAYLRTLTGAPPERVAVAENGVAWPERFVKRHDALFRSVSMEPYVVILGTIEPRKNLDVVFRALAQDRDLAGRYKFIFLGKEGWLLDFDRAVVQAFGQRPDTFLYPGYVSEFKKYCLLRRAAFTIYPSLFEGFGLPILESHSLGIPAVHSFSTSMPEAGNGSPYEFDPLDADSLLAAVYRLEADRAASEEAVRRDCLRWAADFSWRRMLSSILAAVAERVEGVAA